MAGRLHVVSTTKKQFLDDAIFAAERAKGKQLSGLEKKRCCGLLVSSFWDNVKLRSLNKLGKKNVRPPNSLGVSRSLSVASR